MITGLLIGIMMLAMGLYFLITESKKKLLEQNDWKVLVGMFFITFGGAISIVFGIVVYTLW